MENRSIKELLQLMLDNKQFFENGLCIWCINLSIYRLINIKESILLKEYIKSNPKKGFTNQQVYWWKRGVIKPRIEWIEEHIKINS